MWASCSIVRGYVLSKTQVRQIKDSFKAIWDTTMKSSRQSSWWLSRKIIPPMRWIEWPPKPTNYFGSKGPPTLKSTNGSHRLRSMAGRKPSCNLWNNYMPTSTSYMKRVQTQIMVSLLGLHKRDAFRCSNISASVGLKLYYHWCVKAGGNTETIAIHLRDSLQNGNCVQCMPVFCWH